MRLILKITALIAWTLGVVAQDPTANASGLSPACALIQSQQMDNSSQIYFNAGTAWSCMKSIPINVDDALNYTQWAQTWWPFMTTSGILKNPPPSYTRPPVDVIGELSTIVSRINSTGSDAFTSQLDLDLALRNITVRTRDFHNKYEGGVTHMFTFKTNFTFVSLSSDGKALPKLYVTSDIIKTQSGLAGLNESFTPSAIKTLDGQDAVTWFRNITAVSQPSGYIEEHAEWNAQMASPALDASGFLPITLASVIHNGDTFTIEFENGTTAIGRWWATIKNGLNLQQAESMQDVYSTVVLAPTSTSSSPSAATSYDSGANEEASSGDDASPEGNQTLVGPTHSYPSPVVAQPNLGAPSPDTGYVSGYHLTERSLAVLSMPGFEAKTNKTIQDFSDTVADFIQKSKDAGMRQVVIDLQANGGGQNFLASEIFKQFFPDITPYFAFNFRSFAQFNAMANVYTSTFTNSTAQDLFKQAGGRKLFYSNIFNCDKAISGNGTACQSWEDVVGPVETLNDDLTNTISWDYNTSDYWKNIAAGVFPYVFGYGSRPANYSNPWDPKDIILVIDGNCGSTCSVFAELMKTYAGVRRVAIGGLPATGPMQAVSGTRGSVTQDLVQYSYDNTAIWNTSPGKDVEQNLPPNFTKPRINLALASMNAKNMVRKDSSVPLQFIYEAADCRVFFTPDMLTNMSVLWSKAADAIWQDSTLCVDGSTNQTTAAPNVTSTDAPGSGTGTTGSSASGTSNAPATSSTKSMAAGGAAAQGVLFVFVTLFTSAILSL